MEANKEARQMKTVFALSERGGKSYWTRIGVGFVNADGSVTMKLDAIPVSGSMQLRDYEPPDNRPVRRNGTEAVA